MSVFEIASRIVADKPEDPVREALRRAESAAREQGLAHATPFVAAAIMLCRGADKDA